MDCCAYCQKVFDKFFMWLTEDYFPYDDGCEDDWSQHYHKQYPHVIDYKTERTPLVANKRNRQTEISHMHTTVPYSHQAKITTPETKTPRKHNLEARHTVSILPTEDDVRLPLEFRTKYELGGLVGVGTSSKCYVTTRREDSKEFACKVIDIRKLAMTHPNGIVEQFKSEISTLEILNHPNIIRLEDHYNTEDKIFIVMELLRGGELFDRIVAENGLEEEEARKIFSSVCDAIKYMHDKNVIHRDVKPENMLLVSSKSSDVKIIDFGFSKVMNGGAFARSFMGTGGFLAPELRYSSAYTKAVDMWSLGVTLYVMLSGYLPFDVGIHPKPESQYKLRFPKKQWTTISKEAKDLVKGLLVVDPVVRLSAEEVMCHPWVLGRSSEFLWSASPPQEYVRHTKISAVENPATFDSEDDSNTSEGLNGIDEPHNDKVYPADRSISENSSISTNSTAPLAIKHFSIHGASNFTFHNAEDNESTHSDNVYETTPKRNPSSKKKVHAATPNTQYTGPSTFRNGLLLSRDKATLQRSNSLPLLIPQVKSTHDQTTFQGEQHSKSVHGGNLFKSLQGM